jgi:hypothetical protein
MVRTKFPRNVTGAILNKYTVSLTGRKRFIRERYMVNVARCLHREQSRFISVDYNASYNHKFCSETIECRLTTCNVISVSLQRENQGGLNHQVFMKLKEFA